MLFFFSANDSFIYTFYLPLAFKFFNSFSLIIPTVIQSYDRLC